MAVDYMISNVKGAIVVMMVVMIVTVMMIAEWELHRQRSLRMRRC